VAGNRDALSRIIERYAPQEALLAIPSASPVLIRDIVKSLQPYDLPIKTLPRLRDLSGCQVGVWQIRNLSVEDLLDRAPVGLDQSRVHALIHDRVVLITGAGGSIGSEIARQVLAARPTDIVLYEQYENSLFDRVNELESANPGQVRIHPVIGDVTDESRLDQVFSEHRPALVFHAAAHKHVPLMEQNPCEAVKNNVRGTRLVAEAAMRWGVERFVQISTDKAVHPSSVMGATKLAAELVVRELGDSADTKFVTVRFGNVLGSNGSVIPRFLDQIKKGGPVTVTDPRMRRYFMLIPEAVQLVLMASALEGGAIYVLDMGDQISVVELARNLIRLSGFVPDLDISIVYTGIRPGEKLFEELVADDERAEPSEVEKILKLTAVSPRSAAFLRRQIPALEQAAADGDTPLTLRLLHELIPAFTPAAAPNAVAVKSAAVSASVP
jgi:FlaA1/EpsC-like NDP-sugar epimerase